MNVIFTCGGTGGHINPAIAVANIWKERHPESKILFGVDRLVKDGDTTSGEYLYTTLGGTGTYPITIIVDPNGEIFSLQQTELDYDTLAFYIMAAMANANG